VSQLRCAIYSRFSSDRQRPTSIADQVRMCRAYAERRGWSAKAAGYTNAGEKPQPFDGYYFRILTKQGDKAKCGAKDYIVNGKMTGGFAVVAYPAEYRNSGIMTFIIGKDGVVHQQDLGEKTVDLAQAMTEYDPSEGWKPAI
jgi:hypothetical protein